MKPDDIRILRTQARELGIKYVTSYTKDRLIEAIRKEKNKIALQQLQDMMAGNEGKPIVPVIVTVRVPKHKPYKLNIIHE